MKTTKTKPQHFTRGGQIAFHNLRMLLQIHKALLKVHALCFVLIWGIIMYWRIPYAIGVQATLYPYALLLKWLGQGQAHVFHSQVDAIIHQGYYLQMSLYGLQLLQQSMYLALGLSVFIAVLLSCYFVRKGAAQSKHHLVRGSQLFPSTVVKQHIKRNQEVSDIQIDGFPLIRDSEVQHLLVHGTVGTGKSQLIMKIMDSIRVRGDRVIVYDKGCALIPLYFKAGDILLNPFDTRCPHWDLWQEAPTQADLENMAESLIPLQGESDPFWVNAARIVFVAAASKMRAESERSLEKLLTLLIASSFASLEAYLQGTPAAALMSAKIEKTAISIRSVVTTYLKSLQTLSDLDGPSFSIRDYLLDETQGGWIFISSMGTQHKALKPLISMWLAMASITLLSLEPNPQRRIWLICDELPSLHKLPLLGETIAEVRKFGGCFLLGMQSFSQLEKVYGRSGAQEIFDLLNTRFFFRSPSAEMAKLVSRELGEEDIDESRENYSYGANSVRDGISLGKQRTVRPMVSYPEILELPNLQCFVRLPGNYPLTRLQLKYQSRASMAASLIPRVISEIPSLSLETVNHSNESQGLQRKTELSMSELLD